MRIARLHLRAKRCKITLVKKIELLKPRNLFCRIPVSANSIETILCEVIKLEFSAYSNFGGNRCSRELNDAERAKLNELIVANKALLAPLDDDITNLIGEECKFKVSVIFDYINNINE